MSNKEQLDFVKFIKVPKIDSMIDITLEDISNLSIIKYANLPYFNVSHLSINAIVELKKQSEKNKLYKSKIRNSLINLLDKGYIRVFSDFAKTNQLHDLSKLKYTDCICFETTCKNESCFTKLSFEDMFRIFGIESNYKANLLSVYLFLTGFLFETESSDVYCYPAINTIAEDLSIDRKSVINYIKQLHENEILCCVTMRIENKKSKNFYCRWKDKAQMAIDIQEKRSAFTSKGHKTEIDVGNPTIK